MNYTESSLGIKEIQVLPDVPDQEFVYRLLPDNPSEDLYKERTDRHIGFISPAEQEQLKKSIVGIAGCGGMGGLVAATLIRLGIGEVRIADPEIFDRSNINRQIGCTVESVGKSKAFETARYIRGICSDTTVVVYPQGISEETVDSFCEGCMVIADEIEFWALGSRMLLHQVSREKHIPMLNCNTVGFRSYIFRYTDQSIPLEEQLNITYWDASLLQQKVQTGKASPEEKSRLMNVVFDGFIPEIPEYHQDGTTTRTRFKKRLLEEGRASILATNPPMASGILANHILIELLASFGLENRKVLQPLEPPGYMMFDCGLWTCTIHTI